MPCRCCASVASGLCRVAMLCAALAVTVGFSVGVSAVDPAAVLQSNGIQHSPLCSTGLQQGGCAADVGRPFGDGLVSACCNTQAHLPPSPSCLSSCWCTSRRACCCCRLLSDESCMHGHSDVSFCSVYILCIGNVVRSFKLYAQACLNCMRRRDDCISAT
jgi:hypothetical protein